jgi:hypothetical protein
MGNVRTASTSSQETLHHMEIRELHLTNNDRRAVNTSYSERSAEYCSCSYGVEDSHDPFFGLSFSCSVLSNLVCCCAWENE